MFVCTMLLSWGTHTAISSEIECLSFNVPKRNETKTCVICVTQNSLIFSANPSKSCPIRDCKTGLAETGIILVLPVIFHKSFYRSFWRNKKPVFKHNLVLNLEYLIKIKVFSTFKIISRKIKKKLMEFQSVIYLNRSFIERKIAVKNHYKNSIQYTSS